MVNNQEGVTNKMGGGSATPASRWQPYLAYKDSGIEWLGQIPAHWEARALKHDYSIQLGKMLQGEKQYSDEQLLPYLRAANVQWEGVNFEDVAEMWLRPNEVRQFGLRLGDLLVCEGGDAGRAAIWNGEISVCCIQNALHRVRPREHGTNEILYYWLQTLKNAGYFDFLCSKATLSHLTGVKLKEIPWLRAPCGEQRAIAAFLDRETERLDTLIAKKERLIELLQEQRTALISHAVTKGLDPAVPMKDSGIPSVGLIPSHWQVERNKRVFREVDERSVAGDEELLTVSHLTGVTPRAEKEVNMFLAESMEGYKLCRPKDLVINTMWAWMGALGVSRYKGIVSPSYNVYRLRRAYVPEYLDCLYRTPQYICEITRHSKGVWTSRLRLYPDEFFDIQTLTPPVSEQQRVVDHIAQELGPINIFVEKLQNSMETLKEYRTALISAAVTGKIDVRGNQPAKV